MFRHLTDVLVAWGPAGILLLSILDSSGVPVAGVFDALLILIAVKTPSVAWLCAGLAVVGSTVGSTMLFWAARKGGSGFVEKAAAGSRSAKFREWFQRYGMVTVLIPALVPIPMPLKVFIISAGVLGTAFRDFVSVILLARVVRYFGEAWLGVHLGLNSTAFLKSHIWELLGGALVLCAILFGYLRWRDRGLHTV